jgi:hypothetical protein
MWLRLYLILYFALIGAAVAALWKGGVLSRLPAEWVALVLIVAVALGVLLAYVSLRRPTNA